MIISVIIFIIILAVLVFVHELGHFLVAKKSGIRVDEFGLGFPPRMFGFRPKGSETLYSLNWIPFGGFVKIFGENPDEESMNGPDRARSMVHKNRGIQVAVLVAGVVFNVIFAWLVLSVGLMIGLPMSVSDATKPYAHDTKVIVSSTVAQAPADAAGVHIGDSVVYVEAGQGKTHDQLQGELVTAKSVQDFIATHQNGPITLLLKRETATSTSNVSVVVTPREGIAPDKKAIGISMEDAGIVKMPFFKAFTHGVVVTKDITVATAVGLGAFIGQAFIGRADFSQVSGPVGISGLVDSARHLGFVYLLTFTAIISLNLAVINLLPLPALDGGRILFVVIEAIIRRPLNVRVLNWIHTIGFFLLIGLMLVVTYKDIVKLVVN